MMDRDYSEKRSYRRMHLDAQAVVTFPDGTSEEALCRDLSAIGMLLQVTRDVSPDTELTVHVPASSSQFSPLDAQVRVTRADALDGGRFELGVEIVQMD